MALLLLALAAAVQAPATLSSEAACRLAKQDRVDPRKQYSIRGKYFSDGIHGSLIELPMCDSPLFPIITGNAQAQISAFDYAFEKKCGKIIIGDAADGVMSGRFVRRKAQLYGMSKPMMINFFEVTDIESDWLDVASIKCPK